MSSAKKLILFDPEGAKLSTDQLASYFYKISNHEELFKIGKGFFQEVQKGIKSFAFTSTGYKNSQQRTILGLCCYFDQSSDCKVAIISDNLDQGVFNELINASEKKSYSIDEGADTIDCHSFHHHFDFINYSEFNKFYSNHIYTKHFEVEVQKIVDMYDIVLWDIPDMEKIKQNPHFHFRISHLYQSMTVIISQNNTSGKEVESVKSFFSNYNINLNGVLFDTTPMESTPKRKKILGLF